MNIGIYYGSTTGNTASAATAIGELFAGDEVTIADISSASADDLKGYDLLILGSSTWGVGELQDDWDSFIGGMDGLDLSGCKVAVFGTGDQSGWADTFVDAIGIIAGKVKGLGAEVIGSWSVDGYEFSDSAAVEGADFMGLALDESNQPELSDERIKGWVELLKSQAS